MTWWAAVLGFVGALAGSWGGQLIATRREDRRWERERDREELRWQREREWLRDQRRHDLRLDWRSRRLELYEEFLALALAAQLEVLYLNGAEEVTAERITSVRAKLWDLRERMEPLLALTSLISRPEIGEKCNNICRWLIHARANLSVESPKVGLGQLSERIGAAQEAIRAELEVDVEHPPVNP